MLYGVCVVLCVVFVCCVCVCVCKIIFSFCVYKDIGRMKRGWLGWIEQVFLHKRSLFVVLCIVCQKAWKLKSRVFKSLNRYGIQIRKSRGAGKEALSPSCIHVYDTGKDAHQLQNHRGRPIRTTLLLQRTFVGKPR